MMENSQTSPVWRATSLDEERLKLKQISEQAYLLDRVAQAARLDINYFIDIVWPSVEPGKFKKQYDLHRSWQAHFAAFRKAGILAPKGHGKTTQILALLLHSMGKNPNILIKYVCSNDDFAKQRVLMLEEIICNNKLCNLIFPHLKPSTRRADWSKQTMTIERTSQTKDSTMEACGVLSSGSPIPMNTMLVIPSLLSRNMLPIMIS